MDINEIMNEVVQGLSGDVKEDIVYLQAKLEECQDYDIYEDILDACVGLLLEAFPDAKPEDLKDLLSAREFGVSSVLRNASDLAFKSEYSSARILVEELIEKIESSNKYKDDDEHEYRSFNSLLEVLLYDKSRIETREVHDVAEHIGEVYYLYGDLLIALNEKQAAREAYERGLAWNPVFAKLGLAYAATFRNVIETDKFAAETLNAFKFACTKEELANCYCNLGDYHAQGNRWLPARACYALATDYENDTGIAHTRLEMAEAKTKDVEVTKAWLTKISDEYNLPLSPDKDVVETVVGVAKHFVKEEKNELARYFLTLATDLTKDEELKTLLEGLPKEAN